MRELELTVGAQILVPEAPNDLVVAVLAGDHEQLLELLGRLRQRVERAVGQPGGHEEVPRALGRRAREDGGLHLDEAPAVEVLTRDPAHLVAKPEPLGHLGTTKVQIAVLQAQHLVRLGEVLDLEGRRRCLGQDLEVDGRHLDGSRGERRIDHAIRPRADQTGDANDVLSPESLRGGVRLGRLRRVEHHLDHALAVAKVDEGHPAVVAPVGNPAAERHLLTILALAQFAARVASHRGSHRGSHVIGSSR